MVVGLSIGPMRVTKATVEAGWSKRTDGVRTVMCNAECRGLALVVEPTGMTCRFDYRPRAWTPKRASAGQCSP